MSLVIHIEETYDSLTATALLGDGEVTVSLPSPTLSMTTDTEVRDFNDDFNDDFRI